MYKFGPMHTMIKDTFFFLENILSLVINNYYKKGDLPSSYHSRITEDTYIAMHG